MLKVLVVGQSPPPYGGQAIMIDRFVNCQMADVRLIHVRMGFSSHMNEVGRVRLSKLLHLVSLVARIIFHRFVSGARVLYYPPAGPDRVPMFRDFIILISTRWLFDKTVFHYHSGGISELYDDLPAWQKWLFRQAYFGADAAIRLSELNPPDGKTLRAKREFVIPNGIDDPCPDLQLPAAVPPITTSRPLRILFVGILRESKGVSVLVEACSRIAERGIPFEVEMLGQWHCAEFADRTVERFRELNLEDRILFLGVLTGQEKYRAYQRADVLCFPSFFNNETFGVVLVEAMACGLPVVSTRWRAIPSVVDDGQTGFLVQPHDSKGVADRLEALANNPELRRSMGQRGREKFLAEFLFDRHAQQMRRALLETAGASLTTESSEISEAVYGSSLPAHSLLPQS
jgi:glycosyltransferase involved in cell wall biosynthesis